MLEILLQCVKKVWAYIKEKGLQDPEAKQWFVPDEKMAPVFGKERIRGMGMMKFISVSCWECS